VKISDLARDLISLCGYEPGVDIEIEYTGVRPGEKLFEELSTAAEHAEKTRHPKVFIGKIKPHAWAEIADGISHLLELAGGSDMGLVRSALAALVPEASVARPAPAARKRAGRTLTEPLDIPPAARDSAIRN
jgi:FlaA1/EpsC-like NDP-sugar epimerase